MLLTMMLSAGGEEKVKLTVDIVEPVHSGVHSPHELRAYQAFDATELVSWQELQRAHYLLGGCRSHPRAQGLAGYRHWHTHVLK